MVQASHNIVKVIICIAVLKVTSTIVFVGLRTFTTGGGMHGLFSLLAGLERISEKVFRIRWGAMQVYHHNHWTVQSSI